MNTKSVSYQPVASSLNFTAREWGLLLLAGVLCVLAVAGPHITQYEHYHAFADQRTMLGIPCALDVLSNVPFALMGLIGLVVLRRSVLGYEASVFKNMSSLFFYGLIITSVCSSAYHLHAENHSLWLDRMGMSVAFAGILGMAVCNRVSERAAQVTAYTVLIAAPMCLWNWQATGNLLPWSVLQGGGMLIVLTLACLAPVDGQKRMPLVAVIVWYVVAKLLELGDAQVYAWSGELVSGHSLKHVAAAMAAWPVIAMFCRMKAVCRASAGLS